MERIEKIAFSRPKAIILREKDLGEAEYMLLAKEVMGICKKHDVSCVLHSFVNVALKLGADKIHMPLHKLREMDESEKKNFKKIGVSCHSVNEAKEAEKLGAGCITAGHVFATDCKRDLEPRGIGFFESVCKSVNIPVYAIGGITEKNIKDIKNTDASGACIMSGFMRCEKEREYMENLKKQE